MARTQQQVLESTIGNLMIQIADLVARLEEANEKIAKLTGAQNGST